MDKLLTVPQAADKLSVSRWTVYRLIDSGALAAIRVGGSIRIEPSSLRELMRKNKRMSS